MRCPLADNAAPAVPAASSDHATPAVGLLRVALKPGRKPSGLSEEQMKATQRERHRVRRKRKKEEETRVIDAKVSALVETSSGGLPLASRAWSNGRSSSSAYGHHTFYNDHL